MQKFGVNVPSGCPNKTNTGKLATIKIIIPV
jgi:hypothetical protein